MHIDHVHIDEPGRTAALLDLADHFHAMADTFAVVNFDARESLADGIEVELEVLRKHYDDLGKVLTDAQVSCGPDREPELHTAIARLQELRDNTRELLP